MSYFSVKKDNISTILANNVQYCYYKKKLKKIKKKNINKNIVIIHHTGISMHIV